MYASVRTVLKSTATPGIVEGNFFFCKPHYLSVILDSNNNKHWYWIIVNVDTGAQEIDFEILSTTIFSSTNPLVPPGIWATNYVRVRLLDNVCTIYN